MVAHPTWMKVFSGDKKKEMGVVLSTSEIKYTMMTGEIMESIALHRKDWRSKVYFERLGVVPVVVPAMMP
jgi:hypothetical protein